MDNNKKELKKGLTATQDNQLIEACYSMTLNEKRLLLLGIAKVNPNDFPDVNKPFRFEITAKEWAEQFDDSNPWQTLKRAGKKLMSRTVILHPKTGADEIILNWFDSIELFKRQGKMLIQFTRSVQTRLAGMLEQFTTIDLLSVAELSSVHSVRLYELIIQFKSTGYRKISLEDFRFSMDCVNRYPTTQKLKQKVLNPAIAQVNEKSDLWCKVKDVKDGRSIIGFEFQIIPQEQKNLFE